MSAQDERIRYIPKYHKDSDGRDIYDMDGSEGPLFIYHLLSVFDTKTTVQCTPGCLDKMNGKEITLGEKRLFDLSNL